MVCKNHGGRGVAFVLAAQLDIGRLAARVSSIHQLNKTAVTAEIFATTSDQKGCSSRRLKWIAANLSCHVTDIFAPLRRSLFIAMVRSGHK